MKTLLIVLFFINPLLSIVLYCVHLWVKGCQREQERKEAEYLRNFKSVADVEDEINRRIGEHLIAERNYKAVRRRHCLYSRKT